MSKRVRKHKQHLSVNLVTLYVVVVVFLAFLAAVIPVHGNLANALKLATAHEPETFTELYFVNPGKLPAYAAPGKKQTVQFHIQSHTTQRQAYPYSIAIGGPTGTKVISGSVTLSPGAGATIPFNFVIAKASQSVTITVTLVGTQQHLTLRSQS